MKRPEGGVAGSEALDPLTPAQHHRSPGDPATEGGEQDGGTGLHSPIADCVVERHRYRRSRGVAMVGDVEDDLLHRHAESITGRLNDPEVGLVRHDQVDIVDAEARLVEGSTHRALHAAHGMFEDRLALEMKPVDGRISGAVELASASERGGHHRLAGLAVSTEIVGEHARAVGARFIDHRTGTVAEKDAVVSVVVVHQEVQFLGPDHQGALAQGGSPKAIVDERGLGMISDPAAITAIVDELLAAHPDEVEAFRGGKNKLQGFFVGQLMKKTGGKADPKLANQILSKKLKGE